jgi:hypothetical protein
MAQSSRRVLEGSLSFPLMANIKRIFMLASMRRWLLAAVLDA